VKTGGLRGIDKVRNRMRVATNVLTLCAVLFVEPAFAQQTASSSGPGDRETSATTDIQNQQATESSSRQSPPQSELPNAPSAYRPAAIPASELTLGDRFGIYREAIIRPYSLFGPAMGAGIGQWEDEPPAWGQGAAGYGRRIASGMSRQLISETIRFGFAAVDGEDPRYHRSQESGVWKRAQHAIVETFTSETANGNRIPAYSRFAGTYGAAFISNAWYPDNRATAGWALRRGSTALGSSIGFHLFEEFAPRKVGKFLHTADESLPQP
jgi:hypothetical protein